MRYIYKNLLHVRLHGMKPGEEKEFEHEIGGGGIELIKTIDDSKPKPTKKSKKSKDKIEQDSELDNDDSLILNETNEGDI